jgi:hypothetical protein
MRRRQFIILLGGIAAAWPLTARAQQSDQIRRIGVLMNKAASDSQGQARLAAFKQSLEQLGRTDGKVRIAGARTMSIASVNAPRIWLHSRQILLSPVAH